ncbi:MAG: hypothetical protein ACU843_15140 [Gammaproteobacteria bacterium]
MRAPLLIVVLFCITACSRTSSRIPAGGLPDNADPALHAVQNERIHELMTEMNSLMYDRMRTELDIEQERRRRTTQIAAVARSMSATIDGVITTLPTLNLRTDEQKTFAALVEKLKTQADQLEGQASRNEFGAIPQTLERMKRICAACHQLFRKSGSGEGSS